MEVICLLKRWFARMVLAVWIRSGCVETKRYECARVFVWLVY